MIKIQLVLSLLEVRVRRNLHILVFNIFKKKITYPKLLRTSPKLLRTNGKLAPKFGVGAPKFGVGAPKFRVGAHKLRVR